MALHPFIAAMLEKLKEAGRPAFSDGSPADARAMVAAGRAALGPGPEMADVRDIEIPTRAGSLAARLFIPHGDVSGLLVYLHGGGWMIGSLDDFDTLSRSIAAKSGSAVLLPDYRLAPEHPFPAALEDAEDIFLWAANSTRDILGRKAPVAIGGDSAGANLATVAARTLRGRFAPVLQILIYPVTDCAFDTPSYKACSDGMPLTRTDMEWFFNHYAPSELHSRPEISPLRASDLSGLPPAFIITAEYDVLCHEGEAYAAKLKSAGVPVTVRRYDGATHGFIRLHNLFETARDAVSDLSDALATAVASTTHKQSA